MGASFGNHNAKGHDGSNAGRHSEYQEKKDADFLWQVFTDKYTRQELEEILKDRHSIKDAWIARAFAGNERFIQQIVHKLFPDTSKTDFTSGGEKLNLFDEKQLEKIARRILDDNSASQKKSN